MKSRIYFDYAAATPLDKEVQEAIDNTQKYYSNPSAMYTSAREAKKKLEFCRKQIAMSINAKAEEIVFTSSATESNNLAIFGTCRNYKSGRIISIRTEHPSVFEPLMQLKKEGFKIDWCHIDQYGRIDLEHLKILIKSNTRLITIQYANSTIGTVQPVAKIAKLINEIKLINSNKIIFHIDASGAQGSINLSTERLGVDMMTISSSKIYGPAGAAALFIRRGTILEPIIYGGKQEHGLRGGMENLTAIAGFSKAMQILDTRRKQDFIHYEKLYNYFIKNLSSKIKFVEFGHPRERVHNIVSIAFYEVNGEDLVAYLDSMGVEVATGAACLAANEKPSRILLAIGVSEPMAQGSLRISFGRATTTKQLDILIDALCISVNKLRAQ